MATTVTFRGTRDELRRVLSTIPAVLAGRAPDPLGVARGVQLRVGVAALSQVQQDYVTKARGGTGRDGVTWPPLSPETVRRKLAGAPGGKKGASHPYAGKTEILVDTRRLLRSLAAGADDQPASTPGQVFRTAPGEVVVGTNVPYGEWHQNGVPGRLPARPFLPPNGQFPPAYVGPVLDAALRGLVRAVEILVAAGGRP